MALKSFYDTATPLVLKDRWLPTGSYALDILCGRGLSRGSLVQLFGPSQSRKSTVGIQILSNAIQAGCAGAMFNTEGNFLEHVALVCGLDFDMPLFEREACAHGIFGGVNSTKQVIKSQGLVFDEDISTIEDLFRESRYFMGACARGGISPVLLIDSLSRLTTKEEEKKAEHGDTMMTHARNLRKAYRLAIGAIRTSGAVMLVVDHKKPTGVGTGGSATEFFATTRLDFKKIGDLEDRDAVDLEVTGAKTRYARKLAVPIRFDYATGIDVCIDVQFAATYAGILKQGGGGNYEMLDLPVKSEKQRKFRGSDNWPEFFDQYVLSNMDWFEDQMDAYYKRKYEAWCRAGGLDPEKHIAKFQEAHRPDLSIFAELEDEE